MAPFTLETAVSLALIAHGGVKDMGRQPYILHPFRVMMRQQSITAMMAAVLHDAVEDSKGRVTLDSLRGMGCPEEVVEAIDCLTHRENEDYMAMVRRIKLNQIATAVKIADLEDNMDIRRIRGRREGLNDKDQDRLKKYLAAWTYLKGE